MQTVGRIGSYISRSVYNVSGTFHPFGGSVDIIVVEQPDGSFKSSPWYVRFGKFQGVLKAKEKVVTISVNNVEADFHMYLDNRGEAYFFKEVDVEEGEPFCSPPTSSGEEMDAQSENVLLLKTNSCNYDSSFSDWSDVERKPLSRNGSRRYQNLDLISGKRREERIMAGENSSDVFRTESLERAEIAANLLDLKWSTNLSSSPSKKDTASRFSSVDICKVEDNVSPDCCAQSETEIVSQVETIVSVERVGEDANSDTLKSLIDDKFNLPESEARVCSISNEQIQDSEKKLIGLSCFSKEDGAKDNIEHPADASEAIGIQLEGLVKQDNSSLCYAEYDEVCARTRNYESSSNEINVKKSEKICVTEVTVDGTSESSLTEHCSQILVSTHQPDDDFKEKTPEIATCSSSNEQLPSGTSPVDAYISVCELLPNFNQDSGIFEEDQCLPCFSEGSGSSSAVDLELKHANCEGEQADEISDTTWCSMPSLHHSIIDDYITEENLERRRLRTISIDVCVSKHGHVGSVNRTGTVGSLPNMGPLSNMLEEGDLGSGIDSRTKDDDISPGSQTVEIEDKVLMEHKEPLSNSSTDLQGNPPNDLSSLRGSPRRSFSFSFRRSKSKNALQETSLHGNGNYPQFLDGASVLVEPKDGSNVSKRKRLVRTLIPSSEQLASLKLKQGKNSVVFCFSTSMLGKQQVDARIFLWRWDTRIVISDVDGTITRSDLLGQVMPLVGMDWSQSGVAHLFSAIKENGYQLLFLSARSIAQSFLTRQFLFNIKQDGKALPEGPVVISPDGLFPSLFREVIRRAPHEFKISCLEDIKALFPADRNPFYAGFGNRDTDEFSYLKVGIPRGKIFIINPKGEIVVNRCVDTKSYLSLHSLVHGMFPTMSHCEQEDFNSWNYWKLPPPPID